MTRSAWTTYRAPLNAAQGSWVTPVAVLVTGMLLLFARRPEALAQAEFIWEEGNAFYAPTFFYGWELWLEPWGGYLNLLPRVLFEIVGATVPVLWAPLAENLMANFAIAALAAYIASPRTAAVIPDGRLRVGLAVLLLVLPAQKMTSGTTLLSQTYLVIFMCAVLCLPEPAGRVTKWLERLLVAIVALSGPFAVFMAPLFVTWARRGPAHRYWVCAAVLLGAAVQLLYVVGNPRTPTGLESPLLVAAIAPYRLATMPLLGDAVTDLSRTLQTPALVEVCTSWALLIALAIVAKRTLPRQGWVLGYAAIVIAAAGIAVAPAGALWDGSAGARYFVVSGAFVALVVTVGMIRRSRLATFLGALLIVGILADLRMPALPLEGWRSNYTCIGSTEPCEIPVFDGPRWTIRWPGRDGVYQLPASIEDAARWPRPLAALRD